MVPKEDTEDGGKYENGFGQEAPNKNPVLPVPKGRFSFDFGSPLAMFKMIVGPQIYSAIMVFFWIAILGM